MLLTAEPFALYQTTWWAYLGCGIVFLLLVWWKVRNWNFYGQWTLLSFLAAGAFSFTKVPEATTHAPAAIALILELENEGTEGEIAMLTLMLLVWLILTFLGIAARFALAYYSERKDNPSTSPNANQDPEV